MSRLRLSVAFAGTPFFACPSLQALMMNPHFEVKMVITQPDKPVGRKYVLTASPIKVLASKNNIFIQQPEKILDIKEEMVRLNPDFLIVVAYGKILPEELLTIPRFGAINVHASLLPKFREEDDTYLTLAEKLSVDSAQYLPQVLDDFAQGKIQAKPQDHARATYCRKISKTDGLINFKTENAETIVRKIRAFTPWPGCFTFYKNKRIRILSASVSEQKIDTGKWLLIDKKTFGIGTKSGTVLPLVVQPEGKKPMAVQDFIQGYF
ncbi:MAG: Methionyl-tRNA formyltransferase [Candidatus Peregrinibacteria bacterium GW2011_GWA2_47_7]|nr:MAG: Methionyl-tRNA formyltransferase [Candidatus Peregrinibacteria bacterium GW2011_GWA2_47_7]